MKFKEARNEDKTSSGAPRKITKFDMMRKHLVMLVLKKLDPDPTHEYRLGNMWMPKISVLQYGVTIRVEDSTYRNMNWEDYSGINCANRKLEQLDELAEPSDAEKHYIVMTMDGKLHGINLTEHEEKKKAQFVTVEDGGRTANPRADMPTSSERERMGLIPRSQFEELDPEGVEERKELLRLIAEEEAAWLAAQEKAKEEASKQTASQA